MVGADALELACGGPRLGVGDPWASPVQRLSWLRHWFALSDMAYVASLATPLLGG